MKYSTGRNARVRHSTAAEEARAKRRRQRHPRPRHSTGRESTINHFTGARLEVGSDGERAQAEAERAEFEEVTKSEPHQPA